MKGSKLVMQPLINVQEGTPVDILGEEELDIKTGMMDQNKTGNQDGKKGNK